MYLGFIVIINEMASGAVWLVHPSDAWLVNGSC